MAPTLPHQLVVDGHGQRVVRRQAQRNLAVANPSGDPIPQPVDAVIAPVPVEMTALAQRRQVQQRRLLRPFVEDVAMVSTTLLPVSGWGW